MTTMNWTGHGLARGHQWARRCRAQGRDLCRPRLVVESSEQSSELRSGRKAREPEGLQGEAKRGDEATGTKAEPSCSLRTMFLPL